LPPQRQALLLDAIPSLSPKALSADKGGSPGPGRVLAPKAGRKIASLAFTPEQTDSTTSRHEQHGTKGFDILTWSWEEKRKLNISESLEGTAFCDRY
jgi:hypothetical protein